MERIFIMKKVPKHNFFTLIELLVVIAIIAILASMLLPSLQRARESGRSSACIANLKSWGMGNALYHDIFNDYLLPNEVKNALKDPGTSPKVAWNDYRSTFKELVISDDINAWAGYDKYLAGLTINGCPSLHHVTGTVYRRASYRLNYGVAHNNANQWSVYTDNFRWRKLNHIKNPSKYVQVGEGDGVNSALITSSTSINGLFFRHNGEMNVIYVAGNVGKVKTLSASDMKEVWNIWP